MDRASRPEVVPISDENVLGMRSPRGRTALFPFSLTRLAEDERRFSKAGPIIRVINTGAESTHIQRLAEARLVSMPEDELRELYPFAETEEGGRTALVLRARILADPAPHKLKAAALLEGEGLTEEALSPATEAARLTAGCLAVAAIVHLESRPHDAILPRGEGATEDVPQNESSNETLCRAIHNEPRICQTQKSSFSIGCGNGSCISPRPIA